MDISALDAVRHLKIKSTSARKVIRKRLHTAEKVDYPICKKHGHTIEFDWSNFFSATVKITKW